jgi:antitoxin ParD1/3/4
MMTKSTSIILNDRWASFIADRIEAGRYDSASEAIRAGLRLLEIEEDKFERLMCELHKGIDSGPALPFDMNDWLSKQRELDAAA